MGTWGTGLYQDDTACEVRDGYVKHLKAGLSDKEASQKLLEEYGGLLKNAQIASTVLLALAETQWQYGRVDSGIKKRALDLIRRGADLAVWERDNPKLVKSRRRALEALRKRLQSKAKPRRPVKVEAPKSAKTWTDAAHGTVFLLPLSKTTFAAIVLVGHCDSGLRRKSPAFSALKWTGRRPPKPRELRGRPYVQIPEDSSADADKHIEFGFLNMDSRVSPLQGLTQTDIVIPRARRYGGEGMFTGIERIAQLVAAGISGRSPPLTEWDKKFGRR